MRPGGIFVAGRDACCTVHTRILEESHAGRLTVYLHNLVAELLSFEEQLVVHYILRLQSSTLNQTLWLDQVCEIIAQDLIATDMNGTAQAPGSSFKHFTHKKIENA
jgi:hypothetical protein